MIRSMTAFGNARAESAQGSVTIEFRTVNSRFLDINFRLPEDLRMVEGLIREKLSQAVTRGKVEIRVNYARVDTRANASLDSEYLASLASQLQAARQVIPDTPAPRLSELLNGSGGAESASFDPEVWTAMCQEATTQALIELQAAREREGQRLAAMMQECALEVSGIVDQVEKDLPALLAEHQEKISNKLRDALMAVSPDGFAQISGAELSARIAQEASLFSLRIDVAEELSRLRSHIAELEHLLSTGETSGRKDKKNSGSAGKRLDFLFQEMNREANTLGSKASALSVTRAAIDLKLLIEQMREQAQNIE
ncbi:MAG TPA: YicC/YloC family endoribonuclease [Candidimonas sp.]|nr:YicC/YloC family endoribonuclease [Candidimonas sp.]